MKCIVMTLAVGALTAGCEDPLAYPQQIESQRVLAARVSVDEEPSRAWPRPGEALSVTWLVVAPEPTPSFGWAFGVCAGAPTTRGVPECGAPAFASFSSNELGPAPSAIHFTAPDAATLDGVDRLLVYGAICAGETPSLSEPFENTRCAGERTLVVQEIVLDRGASNHNPTIAGDALQLDGRPWPSGSAPVGEPCSAGAAGDLPLVTANDAQHVISASLADGDRELVDERSGRREELWLSHFSTSGRFASAVTVLDSASRAGGLEVGWRAPKRVAAGTVTRFFFVLRDLRGGSDFTVRTACVVP